MGKRGVQCGSPHFSEQRFLLMIRMMIEGLAKSEN